MVLCVVEFVSVVSFFSLFFFFSLFLIPILVGLDLTLKRQGDVQGCQHVAGADTVDSDAVRGPLNCHAAGEMSHRGLRCIVGCLHNTVIFLRLFHLLR